MSHRAMPTPRIASAARVTRVRRRLHLAHSGIPGGATVRRHLVPNSEIIVSTEVHNNVDQHRFELEVDGHVAFAQYRPSPGLLTFTHTEVPKQLSGRGIGSLLAHGALEHVRAQGLKVASTCPFMTAYLGNHPEFSDLLG